MYRVVDTTGKSLKLTKLGALIGAVIAQLVNHLPAMQETQVLSLSRKIPWRRKWQPTPVFLPGEFHGQRSLEDYSPWGPKELDILSN